MQIDNMTIPHLASMQHEQQLELILQIRMRRRALPERKKSVIKRAKTKAVTSASISASLNALSHEQLMQLAALLNKE